jgi:DNA-binding response OmpR family regulator
MSSEAQGLILLVEDNAMQRRLYGDVLSSQGYSVFSAENFKEAEQFLRDNVPALILLDVMMPEVDGIEACLRFREKLGDGIPILFLTAADTMDVVLAALKAGGDDYIVKSGSPTTLLERVKHWRTVNRLDLPERRTKAVAYLETHVKPTPKAPSVSRAPAAGAAAPVMASAKR